MENRFLVIILIALVSLFGAYNAVHIPIDAVPDMTNTQVQVFTTAGSLSPVEVERYVTYPVESTMAGLPDIEEIRSVSQLGLSAVTIVFKEHVDLFHARNLVSQRLPDAKSDIGGYGDPQIGPLTTARRLLADGITYDPRLASRAAVARRIRDEVDLPPGYEIKWGGDFENLQSASLRLSLITPLVLLLIWILLYTSFKSMRLALLIFLAVPMAASGGILALYLRGMPFSISAGVGFIALFGVAVLNGLVWVSGAEQMRGEGWPVREAALETAIHRLRPVLMTALVASFGFLPMALSTTSGAEIRRPLATVVIGGLITSTLLTALVVPAIYPWFAPRAKN